MKNNETIEIFTDYIDDDGYVLRYNYERLHYYNTGICLKGSPGRPGRPGKDGDSWSLKEVDGTYYWFKNGINLLIPAQTDPSFTPEEEAAIQSGITAELVEQIGDIPELKQTVEDNEHTVAAALCDLDSRVSKLTGNNRTIAAALCDLDSRIKELDERLKALEPQPSNAKILSVTYTSGGTDPIQLYYHKQQKPGASWYERAEMQTGIETMPVISRPAAEIDAEGAEMGHTDEVQSATINYVLKDNITSIVDRSLDHIGPCFYGCSNITSIQIPDGIVSIERGAFTGCAKLEHVELPDTITTIDNYAFSDCLLLDSESWAAISAINTEAVTSPELH